MKNQTVSTFFLVIILLPFYSTSQVISTVEEIYDFDIGDEFHTWGLLYWNIGEGDTEWLQIDKIMDKYYSQSNDTLFYEIYRQYSQFTESNPNWTYYDTLITEFYTNLDLPINDGNIDSVYSDSSWFNGRLINSIEVNGYEWYFLNWFVNGCGLAHIYSFNLLPQIESESWLVYYNKNGEEYGDPIDITGIPETKTNNPNLIIYPNPSSDRIFIKNNLKNSKNQTIEIYDIQGRLIEQIIGFDKNNGIEVSKLVPGMYVLKLNVNSRIIEKRFIKK